MVQVQAITSGLPLVCSDRFGGSDLASVPELVRLIHVVPAGDPGCAASSARLGSETERQALSSRASALRDL